MSSKLAGLDQLQDFFGSWSDFHDAEVIRLDFNRTGTSFVRISNREILAGPPGADFRVGRQGIVTFECDDVLDLHLEGFSHQNVISSLDVRELDDVVVISLRPCHGVSGEITAARVRIYITEIGS